METSERLDFKRVLPIVVIVLVDLTGLSIIVPLLPLYAARYDASPLTAGILQATYPMMQFLGAPVLGRLSDRFGRKPILIISQLGTFLGFVLLGFSNALWLLFAARIIDGLSGGNLSTAQAAIADSTTERTRTQGLGLIGAAFGVGFVLGPIIAFTALAFSGENPQAVAFTAAAFSFLSIMLTSFWFKETLTGGIDGAESRRSPFALRAFFDALNRPAIGFLLVMMFFYQVAFGGYEQLFALFTLTRLGMDARDTSGLFVLAGLFIIVIQVVLIGRWSRQRGDRWLVLMGFGALAIGLVGTGLTPAIPVPWFDSARVLLTLAGRGAYQSSLHHISITLPPQSARGWIGIAWLLAASFPAGIGGAVLHPALNSVITKSSANTEAGAMLGLSAAMFSAANAVGPLFYGVLFQYFGAPVPFVSGGAILAILWLIAPRALPSAN